MCLERYSLGMYLRMTKRKNANGTEARYYQLAENVWDARRGCAVAKVVYNFGRAEGVDRDKMQRLAASILRVFGDEGDGPAAQPDIHIRDSWPYGGVHVLEELWREMGIGQVLQGCEPRKKSTPVFERAIFAMVEIGRAHV